MSTGSTGFGSKGKTNVQQYLEGIEYPASKQEILTTVKENGAPNDVIERIQRLPQNNFNGPQDLQKAFGQM